MRVKGSGLSPSAVIDCRPTGGRMYSNVEPARVGLTAETLYWMERRRQTMEAIVVCCGGVAALAVAARLLSGWSGLLKAQVVKWRRRLLGPRLRA